MSHFFRKGGIELNDTEWIQDFADKRLQYGVSQTKLAVMAGISREHLSRIESGKVAVTEEMKVKLLEALEKFNPEVPLTMLFDYVRIRFPTLDIGHIIKDILQLNIQYMIHEDFGHYSYTEHYYIGDIFVYTSPDEEKGVLLELKGKGCRQFESYLLAQERSWYDFLMDALVDGGVMKRLDLAINDHTGMLDIPELTEKCRNEECVSVFRSFKSYASGELVKHEEQDKAGMGYTLYIGSLKSEVYFCVYEKSYEQYIKLGIPIEEAPIKNRFEIRLKNERAYYAVRDLLTYYDAERTAFSIINRYVRFVDKKADKKRSDWKLSVRWAWFIGENREPLKLTTKPEPYTLDRTLRWIQRQVDPTLKMLETITAKTGIDYLKEIRKSTKLTEKHYKIIEQQTTSTEDVILEKEN
jgi:phage replication initiation protein